MPPSNTKPCHNCRRRRLRCDRSWPTCHKCAVSGQECLGYGKVYVWTQGIDAQGNVNPPPGRRAAEDAALPQPQVISASMPSSSDGSINVGSTAMALAAGRERPWAEPGAIATLTDPLFQDLDHNSRYYLAHCEPPSFPSSIFGNNLSV